jgi:hypothetical protein
MSHARPRPADALSFALSCPDFCGVNARIIISPTDTSYSFVTPITSREGVERSAPRGIGAVTQAHATDPLPLCTMAGSTGCAKSRAT